MNIADGLLLADYLEPRFEALADLFMGTLPTHHREEARPMIEIWARWQFSLLRGQHHGAGELASFVAEGVRMFGGDMEAVLGQVGRFRDLVYDFSRGKVAGLDDLRLFRLLASVYDLHAAQIAQHMSERQEEAVAAGERRLRALIDAVGRPFGLLDAKGFVLSGNAELAGCIGISPEHLKGCDFVEMCDGESAHELRRILRQRRVMLQQQRFKGRLLTGGRPGPEWVFVVQSTFDMEGRRDGLALRLEETDAGRMTDEDLFRHILGRIVDIIPMPIEIFDAGRRVLHRTGMAEVVRFPDNPEGLPYCCHFHRRHGGAGECACHQVFMTRQPYTDEVRLEEPESTRWFRLVLMPVLTPGGEARWMACGLMETTEEKRLEKQMENQILTQQRSSLVSQIGQSVAHQLRTSLGVVIGFAEMLSKGLPPAQSGEVVTRILQNGLRCKEIVEELLNFGQSLPVDHVTTDLRAVVRESVLPMLTAAQGRRVEWRLPEEPCWVECAPSQLAQVIMSLVDNALSFGRDRVICRIGRGGGAVRLEVGDDGPGIPAELTEQIFQPFFTTRRTEGAVGLGLSLARAVARDTGGELTVDLSGGQELPGAWLRLALPESPPVTPGQAAAVAPAPEIEAPPPPRVLLVDDERDLLEMLTTALEMGGYRPDPVPSATDALERLRAIDYDALVLDIQLPGSMNGRDLFREIRAAWPELARHAMFITADTINYETRRFLDTTGMPYLEKPFLVSEFMREVADIVATARKPQGD